MLKLKFSKQRKHNDSNHTTSVLTGKKVKEEEVEVEVRWRQDSPLLRMQAAYLCSEQSES